MSGIAALYARGGAPADAALLARLVAAHRFRGPDGEGACVRGSVGLGHALHRTTVEAAREISPARLDDRLFVTADARIDARDELRARLGDHGRDLPADAPDPELILRAYDAWGEECLSRLHGDFSFALWDEARRKLVCAVDALGARAFYYVDKGGLFVGGNGLACARLHPGARDALDERAVGDYLLVGCYEDRDVTIDADVARLPPGHLLVVDEGGLRVRRWFTWPEPSPAARARPEDCAAELEELLGRAVRDRVRAPKVAIMMSGGVDSPLIALHAKRALAARPGGGELRAYSAYYERLIPDDERPFAALAARSLGISIDFQAADGGAIHDWPERLAPAEPPPDAVMGPFLDQLERAARFSPVILTGYDGDVLLRAAVRLHWRERASQGRWGALARELAWYLVTQRALPPVGLRTALARRRARPPRRPPWLREAFWRRVGLEERWGRALAPPAPAAARAPSVLGFSGRAFRALLDAHDPGALGRPIDFRHPLLDLRIIRFALGLPVVPWCVDKHVLRRCMGELPEALRRRPKTPLAADPLAALVRGGALASVRAPAPSAALEAFVDVGALAGALASGGAGEDPRPLLRAVGLGRWLAQRGRAAAPGSELRALC
jgi:asparagine synthase (glutamine-hydrolysing)